MIEFARRVLEMLETGHWPVFLVYAVIMLALIVPRMILGWVFYGLRAAGLIQNYPPQKFSVTALVTVAAEQPEAFERCLRGLKYSLMRGTTKHAIIVIIDRWWDPLARDINPRLAEISKRYADVVLCTNACHKRYNLRALMRTARERGLLEPITLFVDSDTFVTKPDTVERLLRPFSDKKIGGVTTLQLIDNPKTWVEKVSFWLEHARALSSMAAASLFHKVLCLPGRMYAVRTSIIENKMEELVHGTLSVWGFGSWQWKAGDDRFITNCVLKAGYGTVMVPDAVVTTLTPDTLKKTSYMWTRWGRSSQAYTLRSPWLFWPRNWFAAFIAWGDIIITISTVYIVAIHWPYSILTGTRTDPWYEMLALALIGMTLTIVSRQFVHLYQFPKSWYMLPAFLFMITYGQFIRFWALITPHKIGVWATRGADEKGSGEDAWELDAASIEALHLPKKGDET